MCVCVCVHQFSQITPHNHVIVVGGSSISTNCISLIPVNIVMELVKLDVHTSMTGEHNTAQFN